MAVYQDTQFSQAFQLTDSNGAPTNITGWTFTASFRTHAADVDPPLVTLTTGSGFTTTDAANGRFTMAFTKAQTSAMPVGSVVFDIMRTDAGDPIRICGGRLKVKEPVTRL